MTIGTTRGILHAKTEGTCFNKYVLPTINVTEIIKEKPGLNPGAYMGLIMGKLKGKIDGKIAMGILKKLLK